MLGKKEKGLKALFQYNSGNNNTRISNKGANN